MRTRWLVLTLGMVATARADEKQLESQHRVEFVTTNDREADRATSDAVRALARGDFAAALAACDRAVAAVATDGWAAYDRGAALSGQSRTDEAVASFVSAGQRFAKDDPWARSLTIYGRAHALDNAGRCEEAGQAYREYASLVAAHDPVSSTMALSYAAACKPRWIPTTLASAR